LSRSQVGISEPPRGVHRARRGGRAASRRRLSAAFAGLLAFAALTAAGCDSTNPVAPDPTQPPATGPGSGAWKVEIAADPAELPAGGTAPATIAVTVTGQADGQPPPDGAKCAITTNVGSFASDKAVTVQDLELVQGRPTAAVRLYPPEEVGTATLLVQFENSFGQKSVAIKETVNPAFFLTGIEPNFGSAEGGFVATIRGSGIRKPVRVTFGDVVAPLAGEPTETTIQVTVPRPATPVAVGESLTVNLTVRNALDDAVPISDTLPGAFTYTNGTAPPERPVVFSVSPPTGPNEGGTPVTILGDGFVPPVQVIFGLRGAQGAFEGVEAQVVSASRTRISATTPSAVTLGQSLLNKQVDVLVRNVETGFSTIAVSAFRYVGEDLFITDVMPREGTYRGGTTVTLLGQGFKAPVEVSFAGIGQQVKSTSASRIVVETVPVTVTGCNPPSGPVVVTNLDTGESATSQALFSYTVATPFVGGIDPAEGAQAGSPSAVLSGSFPDPRGNLRVEFNGVASPGFNASSATALDVQVPAFTGQFDQVGCDDDGDGKQGMRNAAKAVNVRVLDTVTGCADTLPLGYTYLPDDTVCRDDQGPPVAAFTYRVLSCAGGFTVQFTNTSTGSPATSFFWDFGDGTQSTASSPQHLYAVSGTYTVTLTVSNAQGASSVSQSVPLSLAVSPPICP
jgi:large repetitive protein